MVYVDRTRLERLRNVGVSYELGTNSIGGLEIEVCGKEMLEQEM